MNATDKRPLRKAIRTRGGRSPQLVTHSPFIANRKQSADRSIRTSSRTFPVKRGLPQLETELAQNATLPALRRSLPLSQGELSIVNELIASVMSALL
jgi:hypothetical protein